MADEVKVETPAAAPVTATETPAAPATESVYGDFLTSLKNKFAEFVKKAEAGATDKAESKVSRQLSMALRQDMKDFRVISCKHDRKEVS